MSPLVVAGIDLSLTSTGVARVTVDEAGGTWRTWQVASPPRGREVPAQWARIRDAADRVHAAYWPGPLEEPQPDLVVVEGPAFGKGVMSGAHDLSGFWWQVVGSIVDDGVPVAVMSPASLKVYATGDGSSNTKKAHIVRAVQQTYPGALTNGVHDVADAVVLAAAGARWAGSAVDCLPDLRVRALDKVKWPESFRHNRIGG